MTRANESGAYLGGISTMLIQSDVCPACGKEHTARRAGLLGGKGECPLVVFGTLPALTSAADFDDGPSLTPTELSLSIREIPIPVSAPAPAPARRSSALSVPWPMPSHLEDYL